MEVVRAPGRADDRVAIGEECLEERFVDMVLDLKADQATRPVAIERQSRSISRPRIRQKGSLPGREDRKCLEVAEFWGIGLWRDAAKGKEVV